MTNDERAKLVERIVGTWPAGPRGFVWTSTLTELDVDLAAAAYEQCVRECVEHPPTPGKFLGVYWSLTRRNAPSDIPRPADTGPPVSLADYLERRNADELAELPADLQRRHPSSGSRL